MKKSVFLLALSVAARNLSVAVDSESEYFARVARENLLPEEYRNTLTGARYFWRSDCGVYRRPGWYSSIRMHSERTIGFEFTNKENTLANFSADGAVLLMQDAGEFHNIFAFWDWRKVPGVTSYDDGGPIKCDGAREATRNNSSHVFGKAPVKVIRNDSECQAVRCGDVLAAIFHKEGRFVLEGETFTVEAPFAVIREL